MDDVFFLLIFLVNGGALLGFERPAFSSSLRTISDAVDRLADEVLRQHGVSDLKLEFIDGTCAGTRRRFDAQFRKDGVIFRARIDYAVQR